MALRLFPVIPRALNTLLGGDQPGLLLRMLLMRCLVMGGNDNDDDTFVWLAKERWEGDGGWWYWTLDTPVLGWAVCWLGRWAKREGRE